MAVSPIREKALDSEEFHGLLESREICQILDWSIEVLQAQFEILLGDLDRYSGEIADGEPAAWFAPLLEDLGGLERAIEDLWVDGVAVGLSGLDERAEAILEFSDRLLEYADEVIESTGEVRLSLRLRGMARACLETAGSVPRGPVGRRDDGGGRATERTAIAA